MKGLRHRVGIGYKNKKTIDWSKKSKPLKLFPFWWYSVLKILSC